MSDEPLQWTAHDAPPGIAELVRSLDRPPPLPPEIRLAVRRTILRRISPLRWIGPTAVAAVVVAGVTLYVLGAKFPTAHHEPHDIVAALDPMADAGVGDAPVHVGSLPHEEVEITPEMRRQLAALGYVGTDPDAGDRRHRRVEIAPPAVIFTGVLRVDSQPWSRVFLDGNIVGSTPIARLLVSPGRHVLDLVTSDGTHHRSTIDVDAGSTTNIVRHFDEGAGSAAVGTGTLRVNSTPWSRVTVDGRSVGNTPVVGLQLAPGLHRVTLVNDAVSARQTFSVNIVAGQTETRNVQLTPQGAPDNPF